MEYWKMFPCSSSTKLRFAVIDIFEIVVTERVGRKADFKHVFYTLRIFVEDWRSGLHSSVLPLAAQISNSENVILSSI